MMWEASHELCLETCENPRNLPTSQRQQVHANLHITNKYKMAGLQGDKNHVLVCINLNSLKSVQNTNKYSVFNKCVGFHK